MRNPTQREINEFMRELRFMSNRTQQELANYLNCCRATYTYLEEGKLRLTMVHLQKIAEFYEISPAVFFLPGLWSMTLEELRALDFTRLAA